MGSYQACSAFYHHKRQELPIYLVNYKRGTTAFRESLKCLTLFVF